MKKHLFFGALACVGALDASASCGAAFCLVNTDWSAQGGHVDEGLRLDLRYETIDLDQPRNGRNEVAVGAIPAHHDEVETKNRNFVAALDWNFAPRWGVNFSLPYVDRKHVHIHNHHGEQLIERWSFRDLGDARLQARWVNASVADDASAMRAWGFTFGAKLPTGKHDVKNGDGEEAERTLQPGSGTTDAILGAFWHGAAPLKGWSWFTRAGITLPMNSRDGFKPGKQLQLDAGLRYAASSSVGVMLQANANFRGRDSGISAEPEDSGQRQVFVSPGISWNVARDTQLYAFVQVPVYQSVNGVQLTADWSALAGVSFRF
jgi:hypothetical protein